MKFDVFLSHNSKDKPTVERIAHILEAKGIKVWLDKWNLIPGDAWQEELETALDESQTIAVFVGPHHISPWENEEMRYAIEERVQDKSRRVIPVLLPGAPDNTSLKLPRFLKRLTWVDMRKGIADEESFHRFVSGIKGISPGKSSKAETKLPSEDDPVPPPGDLPIGSYIPFPPNPLFEGRVNDLKTLAKALCSPLLSGEVSGVRSGMVVNQKAITGMGGLGKTQLAVEFAWRYGSYFRGVHWLNLANPSLLDSQIAYCGTQMGIANWPDDQPSQVTLTLNTWKADGPRLLILDNFEDVEKSNAVIPRLRHSNLRLLVTSRRTDWTAASGLSPLELDYFSPVESLDFLQKSLDKRKYKAQELSLLAERLGHLPLALELASRYLIQHARLSVAQYLEQANEAFEHASMKGWREDLPAPTGHDLDLQRTFALSFNALSDENGKRLLQTAGYLASNTPIPPEIFEKAMELSPERCDELLARVYGLGLLRKTEAEQPAIHPLYAEYARGLAKENKSILEKLAETLGTLAISANRSKLPANFVTIRPHIVILADQAEQFQLNTAGLLWSEYGSHTQALADYGRAKAAFERALKIDQVAFGPDHPTVATDINNLGTLLRDLGDYAGAKAAYERALKIDEAAFGLDHPTVATDINNLGNILRDLGDKAAARTAYERALKIRKDNLGDTHPDTATTLNDLGSLSRAEGNLDQAKNYLEQAMQVYENVFGTDHPWVATAVNNLGLVLQDLGDLAGAKAACERALKIDEAAFGSDHPNAALRLNNFGYVLQGMGDHAGAKAAYQRALVILQKFLPPEHLKIKTVQRNLDSLSDV